MKCPNCGNDEEFTWGYSRVAPGGIAIGRLTVNDVSTEFYLGCDICSETVVIKTADEVAEILNIVNWSGVVVR